MKQALEQRLSELFGYSDGVLFGRARSGISALLEILGTGEKFDFVIPSNICPVLYTVGLDCGALVRLCPVDPNSGLPVDRDMATCVSDGADAGLVMPANLYGFVQNYSETARAARARGWFVLENDTMATKARLSSNAQRSAYGDALLVSFGEGKSIDAGGGGVILSDDERLCGQLRSLRAKYRPLDQLARSRENWILAFRLQLRAGFPGGPSMAHLNEHLIEVEALNLRYDFPDDLIAPLDRAINGLADTVSMRRDCAAVWDDKLDQFGDRLKKPPLEQPAPWRVIRTIPKLRDVVADQLRANGVDAGINYSPLDQYFPVGLAGQHHPDADTWGNEVLNLWVDKSYNPDRISDAADTIGSVFQQFL